MSEQTSITALDWKETTKSGFCVIKLGADWCDLSKEYDERITDLIQDFSDRVSFFKIDISAPGNQGTVQSLQMKQDLRMINGIPHIAILKEGVVQTTVIGLHLDEIRNKIETVLGDTA